MGWFYLMFGKLPFWRIVKYVTICLFSRLPPLASPAAGHITTNGQLTAYFTSAFGAGPHTVLLLLQDKVSPGDITTIFLLCSKHGGYRMSRCRLELRVKSSIQKDYSEISIDVTVRLLYRQSLDDNGVGVSHVSLRCRLMWACVTDFSLWFDWALALLPLSQRLSNTSLRFILCGSASLWLMNGIDRCFSCIAILFVLSDNYPSTCWIVK